MSNIISRNLISFNIVIGLLSEIRMYLSGYIFSGSCAYGLFLFIVICALLKFIHATLQLTFDDFHVGRSKNLDIQ